jgi:starvation-inducible DNA-binding protein
MATTTRKAASRRKQPPALRTRSDLGEKGVADVAAALNLLLADVFALYVKTKNFHWHVSGPLFRSNHLLLDEQAAQIFAMTDDLAERVRKVGGLTIHSIGEIGRLQRIEDNDADYVEPSDMLAELREDNLFLVKSLKEAHATCDEVGDIASASMIEVWVDEAERRVWFLFEATRSGDSGGR